MAYVRIKRERKDFHIRIYDIFHEVKTFLTSGLLLSLIFSVIMLGVGMVIPFSGLVLFAVISILLGAIGRSRLLSPTIVIGLAFFCMMISSQFDGQSGLIGRFLTDLKVTNLTMMSLLLSLLLVIEGILIYQKGHIGTSPRLINSKRGQKVGAHFSEKLWMVPLFLLVPGEGIAAPFEWYPVFSIGDGGYSILLVPFVIGFSQGYKGVLPKEGAHFIGKRTILLGVILTACSVGSLWYTPIAIKVVAFAFIAKELISFQYKISDDSKPFLYTKRNQGLLVVAIIPNSPAYKMNLQVGEVVTKVNGLTVQNEKELYQNVQKNSAFSKLEVRGLNGEIRFTQTALYEGEHHELGIIVIPDEKEWSTEAV